GSGGGTGKAALHRRSRIPRPVRPLPLKSPLPTLETPSWEPLPHLLLAQPALFHPLLHHPPHLLTGGALRPLHDARSETGAGAFEASARGGASDAQAGDQG